MESNDKKKLFSLVICCAGDSNDCCDAFYAILPALFSNLMHKVINDELDIFFFCHNNKLFQGTYTMLAAQMAINFSNGTNFEEAFENVVGLKGPKFLKNKLMDPKEFPKFLADNNFSGYRNLMIYFSDHGNTKILFLDKII